MGLQLPSGVFFVFGGNRIQECKSHPAYVHDVTQRGGMFLHTNTYSTETWRWGVNTSLDRYAPFSHQYDVIQEIFYKSLAGKNYVEMMELANWKAQVLSDCTSTAYNRIPSFIRSGYKVSKTTTNHLQNIM